MAERIQAMEHQIHQDINEKRIVTPTNNPRTPSSSASSSTLLTPGAGKKGLFNRAASLGLGLQGAAEPIDLTAEMGDIIASAPAAVLEEAASSVAKDIALLTYVYRTRGWLFVIPTPVIVMYAATSLLFLG